MHLRAYMRTQLVISIHNAEEQATCNLQVVGK